MHKGGDQVAAGGQWVVAEGQWLAAEALRKEVVEVLCKEVVEALCREAVGEAGAGSSSQRRHLTARSTWRFRMLLFPATLTS